MFGGGIRQSGFLASAADYALTRTLPLMPRVHQLAARLAAELEKLGVRLLIPTETNMLWIDTQPLGFSTQDLTRRALDIKGGSQRITLGGTRVVLHFQITESAVNDFIDLVSVMKDEYASGKHTNGHSNGATSASPYDIVQLRKALAGKSILKKTGEGECFPPEYAESQLIM